MSGVFTKIIIAQQYKRDQNPERLPQVYNRILIFFDVSFICSVFTPLSFFLYKTGKSIDLKKECQFLYVCFSICKLVQVQICYSCIII